MKLRRTKADSAIPTSSMSDIAFLLIIFFMVTSVFSATKGLPFALPRDDDSATDPSPEEAIFIRVTQDRVLVDCREMGLDEILPYIEPKLMRNPDKPVILYTAGDATYQRMISVYDLLSGADNGHAFRIRNLSVPTQHDVDEYVALFGENPFETACPSVPKAS